MYNVAASPKFLLQRNSFIFLAPKKEKKYITFVSLVQPL